LSAVLVAVEAAGDEQFVVRTGIDDPPGRRDQEAVGVKEGCTARHEALHRTLDQVLGFRVQFGRGLVEDIPKNRMKLWCSFDMVLYSLVRLTRCQMAMHVYSA
jgi:hypothetical protein